MRNNNQKYFDFKESLFEKICNLNSLRNAFRDTKRNKGAPGVDGITLDDFENNLDKELRQLRHEVTSWTYKPQPVKRVEIPKPNGGVRQLGIPTVRDRVLQTSIKNALEPIIDPTFSENSYGFRPGRNQRQAIEAAQRIVDSGKEFVVDMDLSKFFDRISHDRLIHRLKIFIDDKRVLRLIGITLRCGIISDGVFIPSKIGSVQGSPLSPLLSNVVLDELDKELERRGLSFCRFADDQNIFVGSEKAANRVRESITKFIENRLKLVVNEDKTQVAKSKHVKFLGMTILLSGICISCSSMSNALKTVNDLVPRGSHLPIERTVEKFNLWYRGWATYYEMTNFPSQLSKIEARFRRRVRAQFVRNHRRPKFICRKLRKRGVKSTTAYKTVYSNRKTWALSHTYAVEKAWSNPYFQDLGMHIHSNKDLVHWKKIKVYPVLT